MIEGVYVGWEAVRECFSLDPAVAYLNHGAFGAVPLSVQRAQQRLRDEVEADPVRFYSVGLTERVAHTRRHLATFLGADPDASALVGNTTIGVATVLNSLDLREGDEIVTTEHGYGAVRLAVEAVCARTGARHRTVPLPLAPTDDEVVAGITEAVTGRTRLVIVDQITSPTARLFPVARVVAALRPADVPVLVDAAHVPGQIPVDVTALDAAFWTGNLHKWAFAPRGTALLAVSPEWRERIRPLVVSWEQPAGFPANVEWQGTLDYTAWLAAPTALFTLRTLGVEVVRAHNAELAGYGQRAVAAALGGDAPTGAPGLAMRIVPLPGGLAGDLAGAARLRQRIADELGVEVAVNPYRDRGLLRLSAQVYNRAEEYDRLAQRLPGLIATLA
ncbi:aminotransferase class V-fold PLP-dependent enzyme [Planosporangium thailandense]|uniref:Aminotransferase class V-fold PLP-dependent enzyme n=1 Tax=Planosporangium thailandense TaxID=765197 RepID=A0ABX0XQF0_9ACTN|nr:aminotransferase class V-fold PLP-dependent enzyme [Planosporangium thailandense]NJC68204.1 aminotransferase class V-fold PLP-dependent enzyme [Planosporangium thailandense]